MESNRKRRGLGKGNLMPFYRSQKPSPVTNTVHYNSNTRPRQSSPLAASVGYVVHQDFLPTQPKNKLSFIAIDASRESLSLLENPYGVVVDDKIDSKAASYISSVQERFKLEPVNSERMKCHLQEVK